MAHGSHHRKRSLARITAWILLALGILALVVASLHFAYAAYESSNCLKPTATDPVSGETVRRTPIDTDECRLIISRTEDRQRIDAAIAIFSIALVLAAAVRLSRAHRNTKRILLAAEATVVVVLAVTYGMLWLSSSH